PVRPRRGGVRRLRRGAALPSRDAGGCSRRGPGVRRELLPLSRGCRPRLAGAAPWVERVLRADGGRLPRARIQGRTALPGWGDLAARGEEPLPHDAAQRLGGRPPVRFLVRRAHRGLEGAGFRPVVPAVAPRIPRDLAAPAADAERAANDPAGEAHVPPRDAALA